MDVGKLNSYFGEGTILKGTLRFKGLLRFDGKFEGAVESPDTFIIGEQGEVKATITTGNLYNFGTIVGDITATRKISLHAHSNLSGNINTPILVAEELSFFEGACSMPPRPKEPEKQAARSGDTALTALPAAPPKGGGPATRNDFSGEVMTGDETNLDIMELLKNNGGVIIAALAVIIIGLVFVTGGDNTEETQPLVVAQQMATPHPTTVTTPPSREIKATVTPTPRPTPHAPTVTPTPSPVPGDESVTGLKQKIARAPRDAALRLALADRYLQQKEFATAVSALADGVNALPSNMKIRLRYAALLLKTGREKAAARQFRAYATKHPDSPTATIGRSFVKLEQGSLTQAESLFKKALKIDPHNNRAHLGLAVSYSKREANDKAIAECKTILKADPDYAPALNRLAWIYAKQGVKLNEAQKLSERSLKIFDNIPEYLDTLSEIHFRKKEYDISIELNKQASELAPRDPYYRRQLFKFQRAKQDAGD